MSLPPAVEATCKELGIDPDADADLLWIARDMANEATLPPGWSMYLHADSGRHFYAKAGTGKSVWEHPNMPFYRMALYMERDGWDQVKKELQRSAPVPDELAAMYDYLELDPGEDPYVLEVAKFARVAPMPPGWTETEDGDGDPLFTQETTGASQSQHPLDDFFEELIRRRRLELSGAAPAFSRQAADKAAAREGRSSLLQPSPSRAEAQANGATPGRAPQQPAGPSAARAADRPVDRTAGEAGSGARGRVANGDLAESPSGPQGSSARAQGRERESGSYGVGAEGRGGYGTERRGDVRSGSVGRGSGESTMVWSGRGDFRGSFAREESTADSPRRGAVGQSRLQHPTVFEPIPEPGPSAVGQERIRVVVRARPLDRRSRAKEAWTCSNATRTVELRQDVALKHDAAFYGAQPKSRTVTFEFDEVFTAEHNSHHVYRRSLRPIVEAALDGINGTVFAYGQTGSGKTYTIVGTAASPGVVSLASSDLFEMIAEREARYGARHAVKVGMVELYNEELRDLLSARGVPLKVTEDPVTGTRIQGLYEASVEDAAAMHSLLARGDAARAVGRTRANEQSSRSHVIFRITVETHHPSAPLRVGVVYFVDLAGSERLDKSGSEGDRAKESSQINLSLLMLGNVISKLSEGKAGEFVPFRNSKLTRILRPAIGGNARTAIVACISTADDAAEETSHTLRFAARAANITNTVQVNEVVGDAEEARRFKRTVHELTRELQRLRATDAVAENRQLRARNAELEAEAESLRMQIERWRAAGARTPDHAGAAPATPEGLSVPAPAQRGTKLTAKEALAQISRVVHLGRVGAGSFEAPPGEVVQWVRVMRAERDELRGRVAAAQAGAGREGRRAAHAESWAKEARSVGESLGVIENLVGGKSPEATTLAARAQEAAEGVAVVSSELASLQRQHAAALAVMAEVEERNRTLLGDLQEAQASEDEFVATSRLLAQAREELAFVTHQRNEMAQRAGINPAALPGPNAAALGAASLQYAQSLEEKFKGLQRRMKGEIEAKTAEIASLRGKLQQYVGLAAMDAGGGVSPALFGSAAVRAAREAEIRAQRAEQRASDLQRQNADLAERLSAVQGVGKGKEGEAKEEEETAAKLKQRVYQLSKEVAVLTRERDDLMALLGAGPGMMPIHEGSLPSISVSAAGPANEARRGAGPRPGRAGLDAVHAVARKRRPSAPSWDAWSHLSQQDYSAAEDVKALRKRMVQAERANKELLARNASEARAAKLAQSQLERRQMDLEGLVQQLVAENQQLRAGM